MITHFHNYQHFSDIALLSYFEGEEDESMDLTAWKKIQNSRDLSASISTFTRRLFPQVLALFPQVLHTKHKGCGFFYFSY